MDPPLALHESCRQWQNAARRKGQGWLWIPDFWVIVIISLTIGWREIPSAKYPGRISWRHGGRTVNCHKRTTTNWDEAGFEPPTFRSLENLHPEPQPPHVYCKRSICSLCKLLCNACTKPNDGKVSLPVVELKARPPVWCPQQSLQCTGKIYKHVAHQEEPEEVKQREELIVRLGVLAELNLHSSERAIQVTLVLTWTEWERQNQGRQWWFQSHKCLLLAAVPTWALH